MDSQRSVTKKYNDMLTRDGQQQVAPNHVNCYTCPTCGRITKTIDRDVGVTPFMFSCETVNCEGMSTSSFYMDKAPDQEPTIEWYRPTLKQTLKMRKQPELLNHVLQGGLDYRNIEA